MAHASGTFEVKIAPQKADNPEAELAKLGRMSLSKRFQGDLEATSSGEMLSLMGEIKGSAGYVAIERITGAIGDHKGTFALQHYGLMDRGNGQLTIDVIPDSGTGSFVGMSGSMTIKIEGGKHFYGLEYKLG